jgi:seryl-tRNA synthetase
MSDKMYTETEAQHLVAREVAKQRMGDMERMINEGERRSVVAFAKLEAQINTLTNLVEKQSIAMEKDTNGLREEIKNDFATKAALEADFEKLNTKIDAQWAKLVTILATISAVLAGLQFILKFVHIG